MPILWQENRHLPGCPVLRKFCVLCQKCTTCFICTEWSPAEMNTLCDVTKLARNLFSPKQEKALCNMIVYIVYTFFSSLKIRFSSICKVCTMKWVLSASVIKLLIYMYFLSSSVPFEIVTYLAIFWYITIIKFFPQNTWAPILTLIKRKKRKLCQGGWDYNSKIIYRYL